MKKKILCLIMATLMVFATLPIAAFVVAAEENALPTVSVLSLYTYTEASLDELRALPDKEGVFYLDISLSKAPSTDTDIVVYYRTVDDSAVAKWGDYESVGFGASVTLNKSNGYKARVVIKSQILDNGFYTDGENGEPNKDKIISRRFLFELISVEGDAELSESNGKIYCYLRANNYVYQDDTATLYSPLKESIYAAVNSALEEVKKKYGEDSYLYGMAVAQQSALLAKLESTIKYYSLYQMVDGASALSTPPLQNGKQTSHSDSINLKFDEEWQSYVQTGWCDLGISIDGTITREYWDSDGDTEFNLYYYHSGEKKLALSLYLQGEFDDSTFFGWEHAFEYAIEGREDGNRDDHMDENFIGFTVYDNDGNEAYKVKINGRGEIDEIDVCNQLKQSLVDGNAVTQMKDNILTDNSAALNNYIDYSYYLRLPSNFALADSFSYEFISRSTDDDEIRWLEDVKLAFTLLGNKHPSVAKDDKGNQMVTTNLEALKQGDPLRMSVRFDRPVHIADPNGNCYVTADIYNDKGAVLAKGVKLTLKQLGGADKHYAWDTLVFEGELPSTLDGAKVASLRNIKITDGSEDTENPTTEGIKSFFSNQKILSRSINNIYVNRDFRTPVAGIGLNTSYAWAKTRSIDIYVNTKENTTASFNDYVTVYYQWSSSKELPDKYDSHLQFNSQQNGGGSQTIIGTGNGEMYLHIKSVSAYGKSSVSDSVNGTYDPTDTTAEYTPFGPFRFDDTAPEFSVEDMVLSGDLKTRTISLELPEDKNGSGFQSMSLYYIPKNSENGEVVMLKKFTSEDFSGEPPRLEYSISYTDVGVCVDDEGNTVLDRQEVEFYWILTDKVGNASVEPIRFKLIFDTNDYLSDEIKGYGPQNVSEDIQNKYARFESTTDKLDELTFIYNYKLNEGKQYIQDGEGRKTIYGFRFDVDHTKFGESDNGVYSVNVYFRGEKLTQNTEYKFNDESIAGFYAVWLLGENLSGRYDIQLVRTEGDSARTSQIYSVYFTNGYEDATEAKEKIEAGTLLNNKVYQLSSEYPYFYYKDKDGVIQKEYYNGTKKPATFSSLEKAREYVYYKELSDIYLVQLNATTASALNLGVGEFQRAKDETTTPMAGQYWIRYKSSAWTPNSGETAWVYYYYGMSDDLSVGALSINLQNALNEVSRRIAGYGGYVVLTDKSLFLGNVVGDRMLDEYGMPYLLESQIHNSDEMSEATMCGNRWSALVYYAADKDIYKSNAVVDDGDADKYREYPIIGYFEVPQGSKFQYMTYADYSVSSNWSDLNIPEGESFIDFFKASGIYFIREISYQGVAVYPIYVDKAAPELSFSKKDESGELVEIPVDGIHITQITANNLIIGEISLTEYDRLSYVAVYRASSYALIGVYTAEDLEAAPINLEDGNYYIVVADRSGNHYSVNAKISSTNLECIVKEITNKSIKLTCNRRADQILRYEIYLNGDLLTSEYVEENTFTAAGYYTIYVEDVYGNVYSEEYLFERSYPTVTWKYYGADGKYHAYNSKDTSAKGFVITQVSENQYKISTSVKTRFSFSGDYKYEFVGSSPEHKETSGAETSVTIEAGQSFTLKVYYKNHKDCYVIFSGVVDVTPPSIKVNAEVDITQNGEYGMFEEWAQGGNEGDTVAVDDLYYLLSEIASKSVSNGGIVSADIIRINASDANDLSSVEVYLDGALVTKQDAKSGFSQIIVSRWGSYRVVARDALGNTSEFSFANGIPNGIAYYVDGAKKDLELHGYLNFDIVNGKHIYNKVDYGNKEFKLDIKNDANVYISVGALGESAEIYGFKISDGRVYPLTYRIALDKNGNKTIDRVAREAIVDMSAKDFKVGQDYLIGNNGIYSVYASVAADKTVSIRVYAPDDLSSVTLVNARIEDALAGSTSFASAELSKKTSSLSIKDLGALLKDDIRINNGFVIDESTFGSERIASVSLYYSSLNDLDVSKLAGRTNIYESNKSYDDEGFYLLIVKNRYGNERVYRIAISRSFGVTSSVTFGDGHKIFYSKDYSGALYSNGEIALDILDKDVTVTVTLNGVVYNGFVEKNEGDVTYLVFSDEGRYEVTLTDSYGNVVKKQLEINKSSYAFDDKLLTGYNEKALKRNEGYTNQMLSVDKAVYDASGIYYLAIQYGDKLSVLFDAFAEAPIATDKQSLLNVVGADGDGVYKVICRNRYGAIVTKEIHYRGTPTLKLERTTRSKSEPEVYDLDYAISLGFWSNNTLSFSTEAKTYIFTVNKNVTECPRTLVFENAGDFGSFEYDITYIDEYGFEYSFKAYLVRKNVEFNIPPDISGTEIDGVINTKNDISITFGENIYATYTRNNGEAVIYHSGEILKKDGSYRFTVIDYAGNATTLTIKKDTAVEFSFVDSVSGAVIQSGTVVNSSKIGFKDVNKDGAYIERVIHNGVIQADFSGSKFTEDGKWELIICDKLGNRAYFSFFIITHSQNGFAYTTPYEYRITEMWYDNGDGIKVSYLTFVNHTDSTSSFDFTENGKYTVVMTSDVTGMTSTFEFTVNTNAPDVSLVGCGNGETTINDVTLSGYKVGDIIRVYQATKTGEKLVEEVEVTSLATKIPTVTEGGKYRIVVESEAGVQTELSFVRKHVMNTAGSVFIMVIIGLAVVGLFTGLIYRNKSKTDD